MHDQPPPPNSAPADPVADVRVNWAMAAGAAAILIVIFTVQNYLTPAVQRGSQSLGRTFLLQIITWARGCCCVRSSLPRRAGGGAIRG